MKAKKYYVVWAGFAPGIYDSWEEAEAQIKGFPEAQIRAFTSETEAVEAFRKGFDEKRFYKEVARQVEQLRKEGHTVEWTPPTDGQATKPKIDIRKRGPLNKTTSEPLRDQMAEAVAATPKPALPVIRPKGSGWIEDAIAVDAACSGVPGPMEYRGVYIKTGQQLFHFGPVPNSTNNIGEFLAIVHALGFEEKQGLRLPIYSDSRTARAWVRDRKCKTTLQMDDANRETFSMINRAEHWLQTHQVNVQILTWDTKKWGEIPADFGRK